MPRPDIVIAARMCLALGCSFAVFLILTAEGMLTMNPPLGQAGSGSMPQGPDGWRLYKAQGSVNQLA